VVEADETDEFVVVERGLEAVLVAHLLDRLAYLVVYLVLVRERAAFLLALLGHRRLVGHVDEEVAQFLGFLRLFVVFVSHLCHLTAFKSAYITCENG